MMSRPLLGLLALLWALPASAQTRDELRQLVTRQAHSWETGDEGEFLATLHPAVVFAYPGRRLDRAGALEVFRSWRRDFRDTHVRIHRLVLDGTGFCVEYLFTTTSRATGRTSAVGTATVGEIREGLIGVWKEYLDGRVSRAQAAGTLPVDPAAEPFPWPDTPESHRP